MKIVEHTLKEELDSYIKKYNIDMSKVKAYRMWPVICGSQLSAVTSLVDIKDNKLRVKTESSSAKSLLILQKK